jgi:hypothetical protein
MSRSLLDSAKGGSFMAKVILENMLQNYSQWHTDRAPPPLIKIHFYERGREFKFQFKFFNGHDK